MSYQSDELHVGTANERATQVGLTLAGEGVDDLLLDTLLALGQTLVLHDQIGQT